MLLNKEIQMTMIEKIAQAIENDPDTRHLNIGASSAVCLARIALETLRHPTIEMIEAGCNAHPNSYGPGLHPAVYQYRTMIDAALKE